MKIVRFGKAGKMVLIGGEGKGEATWYSISDKVRPHLEKLAEGTAVTIKAEKRNGTDTLMEITPGNGGTAATPVAVPVSSPTVSASPARSGYQKTAEEQNTIKRQAIGHMTSRTIAGMCQAGFVNPDNLKTLTADIYTNYVELVG